MTEENLSLKKNIKFYSEAVESEQEKLKEQKMLLVDRGSEYNFSVSMSQGGFGNIQMDMNKVEKINKHVQWMMVSKSALDCALSIIRACKEAFKNISRVTLFFVDPYL